jgi:hypothetical protein
VVTEGYASQLLGERTPPLTRPSSASAVWQLALVMCASIPALGIVSGLGATVMGKMTTSAVASYATAGAVAEENLGNMRTVAAFGGEQQAIEAFDGRAPGPPRLPPHRRGAAR